MQKSIFLQCTTYDTLSFYGGQLEKHYMFTVHHLGQLEELFI